VLHCILRCCGVPLSTPHSSGLVRLASGAFYFAIPILTFYEFIKLRALPQLEYSPAHLSNDLAELVCSDSLPSSSLENASGLLKEEMRKGDSHKIASIKPMLSEKIFC